MWQSRDWMCAAISAAAGLGIMLAAFYPRNVTADAVTEAITRISTPTLTIDGVNITASSIDTKAVDPTTFTAFAKPGLLPEIELRAVNKADHVKTIRFSASLMTSRVPNPASRVPMPAGQPTSQWTQEMDYTLQPGEIKVINVATKVKLPTMSSATLVLAAGTQNINALTISTAPIPAAPVKLLTPATQPVHGSVVIGPAVP